jgi:hypothetical protein
VRATEPGLLEGLPGRPDRPDDGKHEHAGGFSLVTDTSGSRVKKLPSFYVNTSQMYAHRDLEVVRDRLEGAVDAFVSSAERASYMLTACEIGGRKGLYGTDFFNRSAYRQRLKRLGARFSDHPFSVFGDDGTFASEDFDPFRPEFLTLGTLSTNPPGVRETTGAYLVHQLTFYRIADVGQEELRRLVDVAGGLKGLSATDPADLVAVLSGAEVGG